MNKTRKLLIAVLTIGLCMTACGSKETETTSGVEPAGSSVEATGSSEENTSSSEETASSSESTSSSASSSTSTDSDDGKNGGDFDVSGPLWNWVEYDLTGDGKDDLISFKYVDQGDEATCYIQVTNEDGKENRRTMIDRGYRLTRIFAKEDEQGPYLLIEYAWDASGDPEMQQECTLRLVGNEPVIEGDDVYYGQNKEQEDTAESTSEDSSSATEATGEVHPYAWLGLQDMPQCNYLDILSTRHYIQTYEYYAMSVKTTQTEAVDGINSYAEDDNSIIYSVNGHVLSLNKNAKIYMEENLSSDMIEASTKAVEEAMANGTNSYGRAFVETGSGAIPLYSKDGDAAEYDYYEYNYPESEAYGTSMTERFYLKDGDVFAIYEVIKYGDPQTEIESTKIIQSMSAEIPEGTFDEPDLSEYTLYEMDGE